MEYHALPSLKEWATLKLVVERGSEQDAAVALHISQSAVSKRLQALETYYGIALVRKQGPRLVLTEAGKNLYQLAAQTLERNDELLAKFSHPETAVAVLRLDASPGIGEFFMPNLLFEFAKNHPDCKVVNCFSYSREIQARLATGQSDLALLESAPDHPDILVQKWMDDELWLVCGVNHGYSEKSIELSRITELTYVLREERAVARLDLAEALHASHTGPLKIVMELGSCKATIDMLKHGEHMSFLPKYSVYREVRDGELRRIAVRGLHIKRILWIARHRNQIKNPLCDDMIQLVRNLQFA